MAHPTRRDLGVCRATRVRIMLALGETFTRAQVADMMSRAARWGREEAWAAGHVAGEREAGERWMDGLAAAYTPEPAHITAVDAERVRYRARLDVELEALRAVPVLAGYHGGPVPVWEPDPRRARRAEALHARLMALPPVMMTPSKEWP